MTTDAAAAAAPREFTPDELAAAAAQIAAQGTAAPGGTIEPSALGTAMHAGGAHADEVDPAELLRAIRDMQARIDAMEAEKRLAAAPDVTKYAQAVYDHLAAKANGNPVLHADPDQTWTPALDAAADLVTASKEAAKTGDGSPIGESAGKLVTWVVRHARRHPHLDYGYVLELLDQLAEAAAKLGS